MPLNMADQAHVDCLSLIAMPVPGIAFTLTNLLSLPKKTLVARARFMGALCSEKLWKKEDLEPRSKEQLVRMLFSVPNVMKKDVNHTDPDAMATLLEVCSNKKEAQSLLRQLKPGHQRERGHKLRLLLQ